VYCFSSSQSTNDDDDPSSLTRIKSASLCNALVDPAVVSSRLSQHIDQQSQKVAVPPSPPVGAPLPPPPPPPPTIPAGVGGLADALKASTLRKTTKVCTI